MPKIKYASTEEHNGKMRGTTLPFEFRHEQRKKINKAREKFRELIAEKRLVGRTMRHVPASR